MKSASVAKVVEPYAGEHWVPSVCAGDVLHDAMNEIELGAHWIGERERLHVFATHCVVDTVQQQ